MYKKYQHPSYRLKSSPIRDAYEIRQLRSIDWSSKDTETKPLQDFAKRNFAQQPSQLEGLPWSL